MKKKVKIKECQQCGKLHEEYSALEVVCKVCRENRISDAKEKEEERFQKYKCTVCQYEDIPVSLFNIWIFLFLILFFFIPGILYLLYCINRKCCSQCYCSNLYPIYDEEQE